MRPVEAILALSVAGFATASADAAAEEAVRFDVPAGPLAGALVTLAEQARITIGTSDPTVVGVRSRAVRGRMPVRKALERLLAGTGYSYRFVGPGVVRIVRVPARGSRRSAPMAPPPGPTESAAPEAVSSPAPAIIVTASKQGVALDRFGGTVHVVDLTLAEGSRFGARGSEAIVSRLPMLASTNLGPGRNKLYIRGVADSSFNGPSQSIVGLYLGDVRLTFNAPDPDLALYDMDGAELLEGPQGTLYGSGSLGGILRLVPSPPDPSELSGAASAGLDSTRHGGWGGDVSGMINAPIIADRITVRAVGYASVAPGYIDDLERGLRDVNRTIIHGGRATLLFEPGNRWQIELGGIAQYLTGRDGQYATRGLPPLTRRSSLAQPFDNDYLLGQFTLRKQWDTMEMVSATGVVRHVLESRFDATGFPGTTGPRQFDETVDITLISNETRISQPDARGEGWVAGWSLLYDVNRISRSLGPPEAPLPITGIRNRISEAALFGQYSQKLAPRLVATVGGRLAYAETVGMPLEVESGKGQPKRIDLRASPSFALTWRADRRTLLYARYQEGYRAGGLAVSPTGSGTVAQRFKSDGLASLEAGLRLGQRGTDRLSLNIAASYAEWDNIQADLIDASGLPYTSNIGGGRIYSLEAMTSWRPFPPLTFEIATFLNDSRLTAPAPEFATVVERYLPNIAKAGARGAAHYRTELSPNLAIELDGSVRYVGKSQLGIGAPIDTVQGGYVQGDVGARAEFGRIGLSLDISNIGDVQGNRFSFGNPFSVADRTQVTPLRPRTVRVGLDATF